MLGGARQHRPHGVGLHRISFVWKRPKVVPAEADADAQRAFLENTLLPLMAVAEVTSVNVVENVDGLEVATAQAALGGICRVSLVGDGLSISPMASTPM